MKNTIPLKRNRLKQNVNAKKIRKLSSQQWLKRQLNDIYVKSAKEEGYYSRSAYKLIEIHNKFKIFKPGLIVIDLGAAPGGWSQVVSNYIFINNAKDAQLISVDLLDIKDVPFSEFIKGDFTTSEVLDAINAKLKGNKADIVLSDMSPNTTGSKSLDHLRIINLIETAFSFSKNILRKDGIFIAKVFQGGAHKDLLEDLKKSFKKVHHFKPQSSRKESNEIYIIALGYKNNS